MNENDLYNALSAVQTRQAPISQRADFLSAPDDVRSSFQERVGLSDTGNVYLFELTPSTQAMDSYGTRMTASSIAQYRVDADSGTPLMNSHQTGGLFRTATLPLGYSFVGRVMGEPVSEEPLLKRGVEPNDDALMHLGLELRTWDYMLRDHYPNGTGEVGTNDLITAMQGKTLRSISIGFGHAVPKRVQYMCGLCGLPMGRGWFDDDEEGCRHLPLLRDAKSGHIAFAWVVGAKMYEHSAVWSGATPGAIVNNVREAARQHGLSTTEISLLEELWGVRLAPHTIQVIERSIGMPSDEERTDEQEQEVVELQDEQESRTDEPRVLDIDFGPIMDRIEALQTNVHDALDSLAESEAEARGAIRNAVQAVQIDVEALASRVDALDSRLDTEAEQTAEVRESLIELAVQARVRALGPEVDVDRYRTSLAGMTLAEIRAEIDEYERSAASVFNPGRPTTGADAHGRLPSAEDPSLYQV